MESLDYFHCLEVIRQENKDFLAAQLSVDTFRGRPVNMNPLVVPLIGLSAAGIAILSPVRWREMESFSFKVSTKILDHDVVRVGRLTKELPFKDNVYQYLLAFVGQSEKEETELVQLINKLELFLKRHSGKLFPNSLLCDDEHSIQLARFKQEEIRKNALDLPEFLKSHAFFPIAKS